MLVSWVEDAIMSVTREILRDVFDGGVACCDER